MTIASVLVHVEASPVENPRLDLAIDIANQFDAKLIGVGAEQFRTAYYGDDASAAYFVANEMEVVEADLKHAEEQFRKAAIAVRGGYDWRTARRFPLTEVAAEARAADLIITSRSKWADGSDYKAAAPGILALQAGRPVLVAPPDATHLNAETVAVAWKDTRETRRAVSDAIPFLRRAKAVHLVEICGRKGVTPSAKARLGDVADYLLRHGVRSVIHAKVEEKGENAVDQLLDFVDSEHVDLVVAGAYGHSRLQEWVFGGFTRALLAQTAKAIFFSH